MVVNYLPHDRKKACLALVLIMACGQRVSGHVVHGKEKKSLILNTIFFLLQVREVNTAIILIK